MDYLTTAQIDTGMTALQALAPTLCSKIAFPNATASEGIGPTTYSYLKIANGSSAGRVTVLAVAGMHAREWAQPDAVISFARNLLNAYPNNAFVIPAYTDSAGHTHGPYSVSAAKIKRMIEELDILLVPCANPDGRAFTQSPTGTLRWRKNRAPRPAGGSDLTVGVDLNRNFDIAWDYDVFYTAAFAATTTRPHGLSASKDPADERFIGLPQAAPNATHPASQPEVRNLIWILDHHPVVYSIDLHAYSLLVMHPWGIEQNGTVSTQNFRNAALNGMRDGTLGTAYSEFFPNTPPTRLLDRHALMVRSMRDAVRAATGRTYTVGGIADTIYPATGSFTDYHFSRQFTIAGSPSIHAFAAEFGDTGDNFQPLYNDPHGFPKIEREVWAVLLALLEAALPATPPTAGGGGGGGGGSRCFLSVAAAGLIGGARWLDMLRHLRDALLGSHRTRWAMLLLDNNYRRLSSLIIPYLRERRWARLAIAHGLLAPAAVISNLALKGRAR
jgi:hypothetical protein